MIVYLKINDMVTYSSSYGIQRINRIMLRVFHEESSHDIIHIDVHRVSVRQQQQQTQKQWKQWTSGCDVDCSQRECFETSVLLHAHPESTRKRAALPGTTSSARTWSLQVPRINMHYSAGKYSRYTAAMVYGHMIQLLPRDDRSVMHRARFDFVFFFCIYVSSCSYICTASSPPHCEMKMYSVAVRCLFKNICPP
uniref:Uncharacterized protein n=1 Tax=Trichogramma kaykai TaxID=54128 RepID=A0ABD2VTC8_9HYME